MDVISSCDYPFTQVIIRDNAFYYVVFVLDEDKADFVECHLGGGILDGSAMAA